MTADEEPMVPVDVVVFEVPGPLTGSAAPHLLDLVDRGLIRVLDLTRLAAVRPPPTGDRRHVLLAGRPWALRAHGAPHPRAAEVSLGEHRPTRTLGRPATGPAMSRQYPSDPRAERV